MKATLAFAALFSAVLSAAALDATPSTPGTASSLEQRNIVSFFKSAQRIAAPRHAAAPPPPSSLSSIPVVEAQGHRLKRRGGTCPKRANKQQQQQVVANLDDSNKNVKLADNGDASTSPDSVALSRAPLASGGENKKADKTTSSSSSAQVELKPTPTPKSESKDTSNSTTDTSKNDEKEDSKNNKENSDSSSSSSASSGSGSGRLGGAGLIGFVDPKCGASGAVKDVTKTSGPNGAMDFLNCGLYNGGWNPPNIKLENILVMSLDEALEDDNSPFTPCKPYLQYFDKYAQEYDLPAILIASIAMQESTCNKDAMGDHGNSYGLMQISKDKCTSGINCSDPDYNVKTGAAYLRSRIDASGGNVLMGMGQYNGWYRGLTVQKATAIKETCCTCQQNLSYLMQMLNGWLLNKNGYELGDWSMGC